MKRECDDQSFHFNGRINVEYFIVSFYSNIIHSYKENYESMFLPLANTLWFLRLSN